MARDIADEPLMRQAVEMLLREYQDVTRQAARASAQHLNAPTSSTEARGHHLRGCLDGLKRAMAIVEVLANQDLPLGRIR